MSNFENEYKKYSEESTPDLWARIEEGVDAYEASKTSDTPETPENKVIDIKSRQASKKIAIGLIAVAACLLIGIPAMNRTRKDTADRLAAASDAPAAAYESEDSAAEPEVYEEAAVTEAPMEEPMVEEAMEEAPAATEAMSESLDLEIDEADEMGEENMTDEATKTSYPVSAAWEFEDESMVRFSFNEPVSEFKVLAIEVTDVTEEGNLVYNSSVSFDGGSYDAGEALVIEIPFMGDIPNNAISYKDSDGIEHILFVSISGKDGSVTLSEN